MVLIVDVCTRPFCDASARFLSATSRASPSVTVTGGEQPLEVFDRILRTSIYIQDGNCNANTLSSCGEPSWQSTVMQLKWWSKKQCKALHVVLIVLNTKLTLRALRVVFRSRWLGVTPIEAPCVAY